MICQMKGFKMAVYHQWATANDLVTYNKKLKGLIQLGIMKDFEWHHLNAQETSIFSTNEHLKDQAVVEKFNLLDDQLINSLEDFAVYMAGEIQQSLTPRRS